MKELFGKCYKMLLPSPRTHFKYKITMKLFLISQSENSDYDTYDSFVVCADNEQEAKDIVWDKYSRTTYSPWAFNKEAVSSEQIGEANEKQERGIILASFNAG